MSLQKTSQNQIGSSTSFTGFQYIVTVLVMLMYSSQYPTVNCTVIDVIRCLVKFVVYLSTHLPCRYCNCNCQLTPTLALESCTGTSTCPHPRLSPHLSSPSHPHYYFQHCPHPRKSFPYPTVSADDCFHASPQNLSPHII